tara:strand:+ start:152 stop:1105 length:954 start_codon:yes stop_codon:yes gene_type:complete
MKIFALIATSFLLVFLSASAALAHDPLILLPEQKTPEEGPLLPNGTISFALYGSLLEGGDQRGFQFKLEPDDRLTISLLIPNLQPENELPEEKLPRLFLYRPDGSVLEGVSDIYVPFDEPFSMTRYIRIFDHVEQSIGGLHQVKIVGNHPSRFTASIGYIESFGTPVENVPNREAGRTGIFDWYQNPVPEKSRETPGTIETPEREAPVVEEVLVEKPAPTTVEPVKAPGEETDPVIQESPAIEEVAVEKPDYTMMETLETPEEEKTAPVTQKTTAGISEGDSSSSSKIYIPIVIASLFLLFSIRLVRRNKFKQESDQ